MNTAVYFRRVLVLVALFVLLLTVLLWRMVWLTVINRPFLSGQGDARSVRILDVPAYRGMITDRQGQPLAISTPVQSLWVNPALFSPEPNELENLSKMLGIPVETIKAQIQRGRNKGFLYIKRHIPPMLAEKIEKMHLAGLNFQQEFKRFYPESHSTAQLLGFTNIDDKGQEGLELVFQEWLMGVNGKRKVLKDRKGHIIDETERLREPRPGHDLTLSIDRRIQYIAYHELTKTLSTFGAKAGSVVVLDSQSGELLAVANAPSFNPNHREYYNPEIYRNRAFTDMFEPGSVIKPFSIASALESGLFNEDSIIDTRPNWMMVQGHPIRDVRNYGVLDLKGVLQHSSNIGVSKLVLASPADQLVNVYRSSGFGQRTESGFPGEAEGYLVQPSDKKRFVLATMSFGYGLSTSAVQLAKAYMIFANRGKIFPVTLLSQSGQPTGQQVLSESTAEKILHIMEGVVSTDGTGRRAVVPGYRVAGKTGTSRVADKQGYAVDRHISSFVGIAPVSNPRLIVVTVIYEPTRGSYYGGAVAAPLFAKVMRDALRILDVPPDKPLTS